MLTAEWEASAISELDLSSTDLSESCLLHLFSRMPKLTYLAVPNCDGFTNQVRMCIVLFCFATRACFVQGS